MYIIVGMASLLVFAVIIQGLVPRADISYDASLQVLPSPSIAEDYPVEIRPLTCSTEISPVLDETSKIKYKIMTPKLLPEGYSLQGVDVINSDGVEMVTLYYWDKPLCEIAKNLKGGPALNGALVVRIADSLKVPESYAQVINHVNNMMPQSYVERLLIDGIPAIGNAPSSLTDNEENIAPFPARIFVTKDNMLYNLEGNMPLEDLIRIAESII